MLRSKEILLLHLPWRYLPYPEAAKTGSPRSQYSNLHRDLTKPLRRTKQANLCRRVIKADIHPPHPSGAQDQASNGGAKLDRSGDVDRPVRTITILDLGLMNVFGPQWYTMVPNEMIDEGAAGITLTT